MTFLFVQESLERVADEFIHFSGMCQGTIN